MKITSFFEKENKASITVEGTAEEIAEIFDMVSSQKSNEFNRVIYGEDGKPV